MILIKLGCELFTDWINRELLLEYVWKVIQQTVKSIASQEKEWEKRERETAEQSYYKVNALLTLMLYRIYIYKLFRN